MAKVVNPEGKKYDVPEIGVHALEALGWEVLSRDASQPESADSIPAEPESEPAQDAEPKKTPRTRKTAEPKN